MRLKQIIQEDFTNYKEPGLFIGTACCTGKCWKEQGLPASTCQNEPIYNAPIIEVDAERLVKLYLSNPITKCVIFGGLEPFDTFEDMDAFLYELRVKHQCHDTVVIYTGYTEEEFNANLTWQWIRTYDNIIIKFGRFMPNQPHHSDPILGVELASPNQYAVAYSVPESAPHIIAQH